MFLSTSRSGAGRWSPAWGWSTVVHVRFFGVQKRPHDREDPFGRKFLNSLLDTQTSFFFLLAIWGLIWMTLASQTIDIATWSILEWECQFADNVLPHAAFLLLYSIIKCVLLFTSNSTILFSNPPPLPAPLLQFHLLVFMCSFIVCMCVCVCVHV